MSLMVSLWHAHGGMQLIKLGRCMLHSADDMLKSGKVEAACLVMRMLAP